MGYIFCPFKQKICRVLHKFSISRHCKTLLQTWKPSLETSFPPELLLTKNYIIVLAVSEGALQNSEEEEKQNSLLVYKADGHARG